MNIRLYNKLLVNKTLLASAIILTTAFSFPLQACESNKDDPIVIDQFTRLDTDGDGLVTKQEIAAQPAVTRLMDVSQAGSFEMGDVNSDGKLNLAEFLANEEEIPAE